MIIISNTAWQAHKRIHVFQIRQNMCESFVTYDLCDCRNVENEPCAWVYVTTYDMGWSKWFDLRQINNLAYVCKKKECVCEK